MAITLKTIGAAIFAKLRDSAAILAKSQSLYTLPHKVFYVASGTQSPTIGAAPQFCIIPIRRQVPQVGSRTFEFMLGLSVKSAEPVTATTVTGVETVVYAGSDNLEELFDLAFTEIKAISPNIDWAEADLTIDSVTFFPDFTGAMHLTADVPAVLGGFDPGL